MVLETGLVLVWFGSFFAIWWLFLRKDENNENYSLLGNSFLVLNAVLGVIVVDNLITFLILMLTIINWAMEELGDLTK